MADIMQDGYCWKIYCAATFLEIISETAAINVAYRKSGKVCDMGAVSGKIFDGDINPKNSIYLDSGCNPAFFRVYLKKPYSIQYVVVFHGEGNGDRLNFFNIQLAAGSETELCGEHPFLIDAVGRGMRVNCYDVNKLFPEIILSSIVSGRLDIVEFEVHSFALEYDRYVLLYQGCYEEITGDIIEMLWEQCQERCFEGNYVFAAIKANKMCGCTNVIEESDASDDGNCDIVCEGRQRYCGGDNGFSVYIIKPPLPHYYACHYHYYDYDGTLMNLNVDKCLIICNTYPYFTLKFGDRCLCLNRLPDNTLLRSAATFCKTQCAGDKTRFCGSETGMSTYRTCLRNNEMTCLDIMRCKDEHDMFGVCKSGCKRGFIGEYCMQKNFTIIPLPTSTPFTTTDSFNETSNDEYFKTFIPLALITALVICLLLTMCGGESGESSTSSSSINR